tara:strand:+ start:1453 stop:1914 length:462 start_codon:yes stop_codon:yes gene_type:complete
MSYDTDRNWFYFLKGKKLRLYRYRRTSSKIVDNQGRVSGGDYDYLIYPDETIVDGLRIEYTSLLLPFVNEDPESTAQSSLTADTSPSETSHLNLNRVLSLAVVDYVRAMIAERDGNIQAKEYFMRQFFSKLADNESNKNRIFVTQTSYPFAIK